MFSNVLFFRYSKEVSEKRKRSDHGKVTFNENLLSDERFKLWLQESKAKHKALCKLCSYAVIDFADTLVSHAKRGKASG